MLRCAHTVPCPCRKRAGGLVVGSRTQRRSPPCALYARHHPSSCPQMALLAVPSVTRLSRDAEGPPLSAGRCARADVAPDRGYKKAVCAQVSSAYTLGLLFVVPPSSFASPFLMLSIFAQYAVLKVPSHERLWRCVPVFSTFLCQLIRKDQNLA